MRYVAISLGCAVLAACGTAKDALQDASPVVIDASTIDADPHGLLTITTLDFNSNNAPVAGIPVVVQAADGTVIVDTPSDANGKVTATILPGATVTAVYQQVQGSGSAAHTAYQPIVITGAKPGDHLFFGSQGLDNSDDGGFDVTIPAYPYAGGSTLYYTAWGPCNSAGGSPNTTVHLAFRKNCHPAKFSVYVTATWSGAPGPYVVAEIKNVDGATPVVVPSNYVGTSNFNGGYFDIPAQINQISMQRAAGTSYGYSTSISGAPVDGTYAGSTSYNPRVGDGAFASSGYRRSDLPNAGQQLTQRIDPNSDSYGVDVKSMLLPWIRAATYDTTSQTFVASLDGTAAYDEALIGVSYTPASTNNTVQWIVFTDSATNVKLPTLPAHLNVPASTSTSTLGSVITFLVASDDYHGWDEVRQHAFDEYIGAQNGTTKTTTRASYNFNGVNKTAGMPKVFP